MNSWLIFWGLTLALVLISYTGLFVWVTAGGMSDIRAMLASLQKQSKAEQDSDEKRP